jgi:hypothetical protein
MSEWVAQANEACRLVEALDGYPAGSLGYGLVPAYVRGSSFAVLDGDLQKVRGWTGVTLAEAVERAVLDLRAEVEAKLERLTAVRP